MIEDRKLKAKNIKLAKIKYFDADYKNGLGGAEVDAPIDAYAFLVKINGAYINIFDPTEELPIYDRTNYSNITLDGEDYGSILKLVSGNVESGPCYVIEKLNMEDIFGSERSENLTPAVLKQYMYNSKKFFVDRLNLFNLENRSTRSRYLHRQKIKSDIDNMELLKTYFYSHEKGKIYKK